MPEIQTETLLNSLGLPKKPSETRVVVAMSGGGFEAAKPAGFCDSRKPDYKRPARLIVKIK
ncbi:hypothetical protein [Candidatus Tokpelaia sp.]|uniref:hypothetical protein n=1 Tax=Candidatus Tokpelaia sp. TaxID=2233777 RepID=UPI00123B8B5F|nr:hypothetical protein [Candidatus Tokpelaia sp.]KAA6404577.1 hypothetical protein DPQ22_09395 [Candidatus Tokpelaia sp.]